MYELWGRRDRGRKDIRRSVRGEGKGKCIGRGAWESGHLSCLLFLQDASIRESWGRLKS